MKTTSTSNPSLASASNVHSLVEQAYGTLTESFEQFCLMTGIESLTRLMSEDADQLAGARYERRFSS